MTMKDGLAIGILAAGGIGAAILLSRRAQADSGGGGYYAGGGGAGGGDGFGGLESFNSIDPTTGLPINPYTGLPDPTLPPPGGAGTPPPGGAPVLDFRLSPEAEAALIRDAEDTNRRIAEDNEATNQAVRDAAAQQERDSALSRNVNIAVGAGLLAASYKGIVNFGKSVVTAASGIGRSLPALARGAIVSPAAPIVGGALQGGLSIVQGAQDLQARNQGHGPYAHIKNDAAAVTAATANTAAATAVGAGSLGLASLDFNRGVHFLGLPVVTTGSKRGKSRLFGQSWLEF
jgi:hypothetical protein